MNLPPLKMVLAGAACMMVIVACEPAKPAADGAPTDPPAPPAELTNDITIEEVPSSDQIVFNSYSAPGVAGELYRMNPNGSGLTRLTNNLRGEGDPQWTADGGRIVFKCESSICASDPSGGKEEILFTTGGTVVESFDDPALSPNGKILAFSAFAKKGTWDIYLYNLDTKQLTNLTQTPLIEDYTPVWNPIGGLAWVSGDDIVYNSGDTDEIFILTDGTVQHPFAPDFSPDGTKIVYQGVASGDGPRDIFVTDLDANTTTKITQTETVADYDPAFSPDGTKVVYTRKDQVSDADEEIYVMNADGSGVRRLTFNNASETSPDWGMPQVTVSTGADVTALEGTTTPAQTAFNFEVKLSQAATSPISVNYTVTGITASIPADVQAASGTLNFAAGDKTKTVTVQVVADAVPETAESFKLTLSAPQGAVLGDAEARGVIEDDDTPASPSPSPSPTGPPTLSTEGQIAWTSDQNGDYDIWVKGVDGSNIRHVTSSSDAEAAPDFSPDGEMIVFHGGSGAPDIYWVPSDGSAEPTKIQGGASSADVTPTWSPDGSQVAWASLGGSVNLVYATPPNGSPAILKDEPGDESYPDWQTLHNGHEGVAFQEQDAPDSFVLKLFDRTAGTTTEFGQGIHPEISPDGSKMVFASDRDGDYDIYVVNLTAAGATPTQLTTATGNDVSPVWSPDGTSIAFTSHRDGNAEIYLMTASGAQQTNFTNRPVDDFEPTWGLDPNAPSTPRPENDAPNDWHESRERPDAPYTLGIALPVMLAAAWVLRRR